MKPVLSANNNTSNCEETDEYLVLLTNLVFCLKTIDQLQNRLVFYLVSIYHVVRDKIVEEIKEQKLKKKSIHEQVTGLQQLEIMQQEELVKMLDEQKMELHKEIQNITFTKT